MRAAHVKCKKMCTLANSYNKSYTIEICSINKQTKFNQNRDFAV